MRKIFLIFLLFLLLPIYPQEFNGKMTVAIMKDVPPMSFKDDDGHPSGIFTDLIQQIADMNSWKIEWIYEPFPVLLEMVRENKIDLMVGLAYSEERTSFIKYGTMPIITSWAQIFVHPDNNTINNIFDLEGKTIGLMKEDLNGKKFIDLAKSFQVKYKTIYYNNYDELIHAMLKKEVDAGSFYLLYALFDPRIKQTNIIFTPGDSYFGIPINNKKMYPVLAKIDNQIAEWKANQNSFYYHIYDKYFKQFDKTKMPVFAYYIAAGVIFLAIFLYFWSYFLRKRLILKIKENIKQQKKFKNLYDNIHQLIFYYSIDGTIIDVNNCVEEYFDLKKENILGKKLKDFIQENNLIFINKNDIAYKDEEYAYQVVLRTKEQFSNTIGISIKTKPVIWFNTITAPEFDESGEIFRIYAVLSDITELKTALDKIEEREKESKKIIENMSSGFAYHKMIYDDKGNAIDYEFIQTNETFHRLTGMPTDCIGKTLGEKFPELLKDESKWVDMYAEVARTLMPKKIERYSDAIRKWFDISVYSPKKGYFVTIFNDITERKQKEQILKASEDALRENQKRLSTTFESIGDGVITVDNSFRVTMMNKVAKDILCLESGYFGADLDQILKIKDINVDGYSMKELAQKVLDTKTSYYIQYAELNIENIGMTKIIEDSISPIYNDDVVYGLVIVFRDITEKTMDKKKNEELQKQLNQSQKMDSIGQFSGGIAHNFNNIITAINGYVSLIEDDAQDFKYKEEIKEIKKAASRATALTSQLLTVSKRQTSNPDILDLKPVMEDLVNMIKSIVGENIQVTTSFNSKQKIKADQNQIEQILLNFAANSRDAMKENPVDKPKKIMIESNDQYITKEHSEKYFDTKEGEYVVISFSDTGSGIPEKIRGKIFDPFFTTKESGKGTGLGLSTVYGIVQQNNAILHLYSEIGIGTTFKVFWPITHDTKEIEQHTTSKSVKTKGNENVLFVEDEESLRNLANKFLTDLGYKMFIASDGQDGLDKLNGHASEIDIVVTDVVMPRMNGTELYKEMKKVNPNIKVLFTSGYTKNYAIGDKPIYEDHETYFLSKPYSFKTLAQKIREILDN